MQLPAFEAALRLIMPGPGDQPLLRILQTAMKLADCPMGMIGVRRPDIFQPLVVCGLPLAAYRETLPRSSELAERLIQTVFVEDAANDPDFAHHAFVVGAPQWRYIANVPIPLGALPLDVVMSCADSRLGHPRRIDLQERLEACAVIAADEFRLLGDVASQSETIVEAQSTSQMREHGVRSASVPMALIDGNGIVQVMNARLAAIAQIDSQAARGQRFPALFPLDEVLVASRLQDLLADGSPANAIAARLANAPRRNCLIDMIRVVSIDGNQPMVLCTVTDRTRTMVETRRVAAPTPDSPSVVTEFLLTTLIKQRRLLRRGVVPYHALRRWRASVKDAQLAALKALKNDPSDVFVHAVAEEIAATARALYGQETFQAVVAVPCGNSGPGCLAARLAPAVAGLLDLPHIDAFDPLPPSGGSHPQANVRRAKMHQKSPVDCPVLLIDDVATSGAHLAEAALALKAAGAPAVLPMAWLAAS